MTRRLAAVLVGGSLVCTIACQKSPAAPTVTAITVQSTSAQLFLGATETFTAVATLSNGTQPAVTDGVWSSDAPAIASVDGTGKVTGKASGSATISVDSQGTRGSKTIRVLPNYAGAATGTIFYGNCSSSGWTPGCSTIDDDLGHVATAALTQVGDTVSGTITAPFITSNFSGTINSGGGLSGTSTGVSGTKTYTATWTLTSVTAGVITGTFHMDGQDSASPLSTISINGTLNVTHP
jgi:hypothetical protein